MVEQRGVGRRFGELSGFLATVGERSALNPRARLRTGRHPGEQGRVMNDCDVVGASGFRVPPRASDEANDDRPLLTIELVEDDGASVMRLRGEVDLSTRTEMELALEIVLMRHEPRVVLDLLHLDFVDVHGVYTWKDTAEVLQRRGAELVLRNASSFSCRLFELVGLDEFARVEPRGCDADRP
jgi:anti-anti-sigma factor